MPQTATANKLRIVADAAQSIIAEATFRDAIACADENNLQPGLTLLAEHYTALDSDERLREVLDECVFALAADLIDRNAHDSRMLLAECQIRPLTAECVVVDQNQTLHLFPQALQWGAVETQAPSRLIQTLCGVMTSAGTLKSAPRGAFAETPQQLHKCQGCSVYADDVDEAYELCDSDPWGEPSVIWNRLTSGIESSIRGLLAAGQCNVHTVNTAAEAAWWPICVNTAASMAINRVGLVLPQILGDKSHNLQSRLPGGRPLSELLDERDWQDVISQCFAPGNIIGQGKVFSATIVSMLDGMLAPGISRH